MTLRPIFMKNINILILFLGFILNACSNDGPEWVNKPFQLHGVGECVVENWPDVSPDIKANLKELRDYPLVIRSQAELDNLIESGQLKADGLFTRPVNSPETPIDFTQYTLLLSYNMLGDIPYKSQNSFRYNTVDDYYMLSTTYLVDTSIMPELTENEVCIARNAVLVRIPPTAVVRMVYGTGVEYDKFHYYNR